MEGPLDHRTVVIRDSDDFILDNMVIVYKTTGIHHS